MRHPTKKALPVMGVESRATLTYPTIYLNRTSCKCVFSFTMTFIHTNNYTHINSLHKHSMYTDNKTICFARSTLNAPKYCISPFMAWTRQTHRNQQPSSSDRQVRLQINFTFFRFSIRIIKRGSYLYISIQVIITAVIVGSKRIIVFLLSFLFLIVSVKRYCYTC